MADQRVAADGDRCRQSPCRNGDSVAPSSLRYLSEFTTSFMPEAARATMDIGWATAGARAADHNSLYH